jgi:nucleoside-diphosphate-sugar epimerase
VILLTGADGYIGSKVASELLAQTEQPLILWMRSRDNEEFESKKAKLGALLPSAANRVTFAWGDLRDKEPFAMIESRVGQITSILHGASVIQFNVDEKTANAVNIEGTRKTLELAKKCSKLENYTYLSTVYASGLKPGLITETRLGNEAGFANHYERSKWASEELLQNEFGSLPWQILRISTAIADGNAGKVVQQNVFHNTLKLLYYGLISLVPGTPETPLYFVTGDFVAESIRQLFLHSKPHSIFHICHSREESLTLSELLDVTFERFNEDPSFVKRKILRPLYSDQESFGILTEAMGNFTGGIVNQAVGSMAPFARQLYISKSIENKNLVAALPRYETPDPKQLIRNTISVLLASRWGQA